MLKELQDYEVLWKQTMAKSLISVSPVFISFLTKTEFQDWDASWLQLPHFLVDPKKFTLPGITFGLRNHSKSYAIPRMECWEKNQIPTKEHLHTFMFSTIIY